MNLEMTLRVLRAEEGLVLHGHYDEIGNVWDIGYGYNLTAHGVSATVAKNLVWTKEQAEKALLAEVMSATSELEAHFPQWNDAYDDVRQAVFISGVFQLGIGSARKFVNTIRYIKEKNWEKACANLNLSKWRRQTPARVARLCLMLQTGQWPTEINGIRIDSDIPTTAIATAQPDSSVWLITKDTPTVYLGVRGENLAHHFVWCANPADALFFARAQDAALMSNVLAQAEETMGYAITHGVEEHAFPVIGPAAAS